MEDLIETTFIEYLYQIFFPQDEITVKKHFGPGKGGMMCTANANLYETEVYENDRWMIIWLNGVPGWNR